MITSPSPEQRATEYERWLTGSSLSAAGFRWMMGPGQWAVNAALYRLPANLKLDSSAKILDIGCGRGTIMRMLDDQLQCQVPPVGLDVSSAMLDLARSDENNPQRGAGLVQGSGTALPFRTASFNLALCGHLVKHFDDIDVLGLLMEIRRVLEPGGLALIWEFGPTGNPRLDAWNARVVSTGVKEPRLRSQKALKRLASDAGFEFVRDADLRPFLLPPIPRSSILIGVPPEE
ncbi:MAG: methyltransferase domain-containing protein [Chloroflexi bacterium]|nr:methyltransferase domain-containing protein [Chloroflexota bacterium]MQC48419.1 class I SAM-dependent methyltransferase [Chloroflexota bacterium]